MTGGSPNTVFGRSEGQAASSAFRRQMADSAGDPRAYSPGIRAGRVSHEYSSAAEVPRKVTLNLAPDPGDAKKRTASCFGGLHFHQVYLRRATKLTRRSPSCPKPMIQFGLVR